MSIFEKNANREGQDNRKKAAEIEKLEMDTLEKVSGGNGLRGVDKIDTTDVDDNTRSKA